MKNNINGDPANGVRAAIPEELPCMSYSIWNVKIGQNNLWIGPKAALYSTQLFAKITGNWK